MKRIFIVLSFLLITIISYSDVKWEGEDGRVTIIYKIVDPIIVDVEQPQKLIVSANQKKFTYSEVNRDKKRINVRINAPYNQNHSIDSILRAIYEKVYLELQNDGKFELQNEKKSQNIIKGKGYFVDNEAKVMSKDKQTFYSKEFSNRVNGNKFYTTSQIDADFEMDENMPMGVYKGTLKLNVWFGGSI